jgi:hypothetical protein
MNGKATVGDELYDLVESGFATVKPFRSNPGFEITSDDAEQKRFEDRPILRIKRTVDKDAVFEIRREDGV